MIFEFNKNKLDIDVEKTKAYYSSAPTTVERCDCIDCRNYEKYTEYLSPKVENLFNSLGIDASRSASMRAIDTSDAEVIVYSGKYYAAGVVIESDGAEYAVTRNFAVLFSTAADCNETGLGKDVVEVEIKANVPWVLTVKNPY